MNTIQWYDILRLGTSTLAVTAMWLLGLSWLRRGKDFSTRLKDFWWATNAMLFFIAANTVEQVLRDRDATWTLPIGFCAAAVSIKAARSKNRALLLGDSGSHKSTRAPRTSPLSFCKIVNSLPRGTTKNK